MLVASLFSTRSRAPRRRRHRRHAVDDSSAKHSAVPVRSAPNEQRRCGSLGPGAASRRGELRQRTQVWRRAWMRSRSDGRDGNGDDADGSLRLTCGDSITSGTTYSYTASTTTATTDSTGGPAAHAFSMPLPAAPVVEEKAQEEQPAAKDLGLEEDRVEKLEHIKGLVVEFRGDMGAPAVERWLSELDVGWVLHLAGKHESSRPRSVVVTLDGFRILVGTWILALRKIGESILFTSLDGWYSQNQSQDQDEGTNRQPSASEFAQLVQATVLKMLPFVDIAAAKTMDRPGAPAEKLQVLIDMHDALSMASQHILSLQVESTTDGAIGDLLLAELTKLNEAIWGTILEVMNTIMAWTWTGEGGSCDIHNVAHSIVSYTKVLWPNYGLVNRVLHDAILRAEYEPEKNENVSHISNLIMEMISSLERKPSITKSSLASSFPDESLRFLFLINNSYYLLQESSTICHLDFPSVFLTHKIDNYIDSYLHESWAPVLKCLQDPATPCCFTRYSSPLSKFESKFQKIYTAQKLWKVPDPCMRKRLRKAIVDTVTPVFTQFLEDHSIVTPRYTPRKLDKMLGELFEG